MTPPQPSSSREVKDASVPELVSGIVGDTGDLLGAHVAAVRNELAEGLADLRDRTRAAVFAAAAGIVAAVALTVALAASLIALGVFPWLAYWIVTTLAMIGLAVMLKRAATPKRGPAGGDPAAAIARAGKDAAWIADRASDTVT